MQKSAVLFIFIYIFNHLSFSAVISGTVSDENGAPLPFVSVYVKNSTSGVSANYQGKYFLELTAGDYTLVYSCLGYLSFEKQISVSYRQYLTVDVQLVTDVTIIGEVEIIADKINLAKIVKSEAKQEEIP
jgi:hypothetical protein